MLGALVQSVQGGGEETRRMVGIFPNETSVATFATEIALRSSEEEWGAKTLPLVMDIVEASEKPNPRHSRR
jgi:hypothetical protein